MIKKSILVVICMLLLSACVEDYDKNDIKDKVKSDIGLTKFEVDQETSIRIEEDKYEDIIWNITDSNTGMVFHIVDDFYWGMESVSNSLWDDYDAAVLSFIYEDLPELQYLSIYVGIEDGLYVGRINGEFADLEELKSCYEELEFLKESFSDLGYQGLSIWYELEYMHPLRNAVSVYIEDSGDISGRTSYDKTYEEMKTICMLTALDYRYDVVNDLSAEELEEILEDYNNRLGIYRGEAEEFDEYELEQITYYDDIIANKYSYGVSFSTFYEVLVREGFEVTGDCWHYSFIGKDDICYEISYDFTDYDYGENKGYYYLKDNVKTPMGYYFYNHFNRNAIEEMTGLRLVLYLV
ncbi:MAG: hypothetical protein R3Y24_08165 [Eubacteriales bacterium]